MAIVSNILLDHLLGADPCLVFFNLLTG